MKSLPSTRRVAFLPLLLPMLLGLPLPSHPAEVALSMADNGVRIDAAGVGSYIIEAPSLSLEGTKEKPAFDASSPTEGVAKYASGAEIRLQIKGGEIVCDYQVPAGAKRLMFQLKVPGPFGRAGGQFAFGEGGLKPFPPILGDKMVEQGSGDKRNFTLANADGSGFTVENAAHWNALMDNRAFNNWDVFAWQSFHDFKSLPRQGTLVIKIKPFHKSGQGAGDSPPR